MKNSMILSANKPRILRNGKIVISKKEKNTIKKKHIPKKKINNKLSFVKRSSNNISNLSVKNEMMIASNYNHMFDNSREIYVLLTKLPPSIINKFSINDHNNNNLNKNYTKLEDYIQLNELQIYNKLEPKVEKCHMLTDTKETEQMCMASNSFNNKSVLKAKTCDHTEVNQTQDVRITRGKTMKLQTEERKQLDQIMFDKFPDNTFKMFAIKLYDINEEVKFLRTLGLICRFKCPFTCKAKRKT